MNVVEEKMSKLDEGGQFIETGKMFFTLPPMYEYIHLNSMTKFSSLESNLELASKIWLKEQRKEKEEKILAEEKAGDQRIKIERGIEKQEKTMAGTLEKIQINAAEIKSTVGEIKRAAVAIVNEQSKKKDQTL
jgi:hypothetical protein